MRLPLRAVRDYDVDRPQVQRRQRQSRAVLIARALRARHVGPPCRDRFCLFFAARMSKALGWLWRRGPPLPIPNREVKPASADGTGVTPGRVGRCPFFIQHTEQPRVSRGCLCFGGSPLHAEGTALKTTRRMQIYWKRWGV
jgi:hypothetical protein